MTARMKLFCLMACVLFAVGCSSSTTGVKAKGIAGVWEGEDHFGQTMKFTFEEDGKLWLRVEANNSSFVKYGTYSVDLSQNPAHLDIKLQDRDAIQTILEQIDEEHIAFESINSGDERPVSFGERRIVLERQQ